MARVTVTLQSIEFKQCEITEKNREHWELFKSKYLEVVKNDDHVIISNEEDDKPHLFDTESMEWHAEFGGGDVEEGYISFPGFADGYDVSSSRFFALTKGEGQGWSWGLKPYEDELYLTLAKIFGSYSWTIYLYENTADSEERLDIYVSEDSIKTEVFEP